MAEITLATLADGLGLSEFMLGVLYDLLRHGSQKKRPFEHEDVLLELYCANEAIESLSLERLERDRELIEGDKKKSGLPEEALRKALVSRREKKLAKTQVLLAGTDNQYERLTPEQRDQTMRREFVALASTARGYCIFVYYIGPPGNADELKRPANWLPVPRSHLALFHRHIGPRVSDYYRHTSLQQTEGVAGARDASFDPRFIVTKWLDKRADKAELKLQLLGEHAHLFKSRTTLPEPQPPYMAQPPAPEFDAEADRLAQQARGYTAPESYARVTMEEFPRLLRVPLDDGITFTLEDLKQVTRGLKQPGTPYELAPLLRASAIALAPRAAARRVVPLVADQQRLILERDNAQPLLRALTTDPACIREIQARVTEYCWALMALEAASREVPPEIHDALINK
jgi:hypothetical protein